MAIPKMIGSDRELSTSGTRSGRDGAVSIEPWDVTQHVLEKIGAAFHPLGHRPWSRDASRKDGYGFTGGYQYSFDCLRHWLPGGQVAYSDLAHVELGTAETLFPRTYAAQSLCALRIAETARERAEDLAEPGTRYSLTTSNVDMLDPSVSWGTHDNVTVSTALWVDLFIEQYHPARLGFVASSMAAAIAFFGAGYIMPLKHGPVFSLSARAHHLSKLRTHSTTDAFNRGILNTRREPHGKGQERLHLIGFDYAPISSALKCSYLQCALAAAEEGFCDLNLFEPVRALRTWSWNLNPETGTLVGTAPLVGGKAVTLPEYIRMVTERLLEMCESGLITDAVAPDARELLPIIIDMTRHAENGELEQLARHSDWAAKFLCLMDLCEEPGTVFGDASTRLADHDFASTREDSMLWRLWEKDLVDPLVDMSRVEECLLDGPSESRAWGRGRLIQKFHDDITAVDWSYVELRRGTSTWGPRLRVEMPRLDSLNRASFANCIERARDVEDLKRLLDQGETELAVDADPVMDIRSQLSVEPEEPDPEDTPDSESADGNPDYRGTPSNEGDEHGHGENDDETP